MIDMNESNGGGSKVDEFVIFNDTIANDTSNNGLSFNSTDGHLTSNEDALNLRKGGTKNKTEG